MALSKDAQDLLQVSEKISPILKSPKQCSKTLRYIQSQFDAVFKTCFPHRCAVYSPELNLKINSLWLSLIKQMVKFLPNGVKNTRRL